jgi:hypothetical protein
MMLNIRNVARNVMYSYYMCICWPLNYINIMSVVCVLLGNSPASEFYMPTFRNTLSVPSPYADRYEEFLHTYPPMEMEQSVPKRRHIQFRRRGITQKKAYSIQNKTKVWNLEHYVSTLLSLYKSLERKKDKCYKMQIVRLTRVQCGGVSVPTVFP